jgi:hypothetical protein
MSPNVWLNFDDDHNLIATDGERQYKKWNVLGL